MPRLSFPQLAEIYRGADFDPNSQAAVINVRSPEILQTLRQIDQDDVAQADSGIAFAQDPAQIALGDEVAATIGPPRIALGGLFRTLSEIISFPDARISEPENYFVTDAGLERTTQPPPDELLRYRSILSAVSLICEASSYVDRTKRELIFVSNQKVSIPILYDWSVVQTWSLIDGQRFIDTLAGELHRDERLRILSEEILQVATPQPREERLRYILLNISSLTSQVVEGYKLFASSFSYTRIKGEIEGAKIEFASKIHKTIIDIQGQLLGIPVASIVVATQLKATKACDNALVGDIAVVIGSWVFFVLLMFGLANQWATLGVIKSEIDRQVTSIEADYSPISAIVVGPLKSLTARVFWHRVALIAIGLIAALAAAFATWTCYLITNVDGMRCLIGRTPMTIPTT